MHITRPQLFAAKVATAVLVGLMVGHWFGTSARASAPMASAYCQSNACVTQTWLWLPAMRRAH